MTNFAPLSLCFDLDGTLVDTAPDLVRILNKVLKAEDLPETDFEAARRSVGYGARRLISEACMRVNHPLSDARLDMLQALFLQHYRADLTDLPEPYPATPYSGVPETLMILKSGGAELSVCTNKPGFLARPLLDRLNMSSYFIRIIGSDDTPQNKPHADHIYQAAGHRGQYPIIMIGDSEPDSLAARNAGVPSILMRYGYSNIALERLGATKILDHFRDIPKTVEALIK